MKRICVVAFLSVGACVPRPVYMPADISITRLENTGLRACDIIYGWTYDELAAHCGDPDGHMSWVGHQDGKCFIYNSSAHTFRSVAGATAVAVCLEKVTNVVFERDEKKGSKRVRDVAVRVSGVYGLRERFAPILATNPG